MIKVKFVLRVLSIPHLELCGAGLLAKLIKRISSHLTMSVSSMSLFSDSQIVLSWINISPHLLKTFVANRVSQIPDDKKNRCWSHISGSKIQFLLPAVGLIRIF